MGDNNLRRFLGNKGTLHNGNNRAELQRVFNQIRTSMGMESVEIIFKPEDNKNLRISGVTTFDSSEPGKNVVWVAPDHDRHFQLLWEPKDERKTTAPIIKIGSTVIDLGQTVAGSVEDRREFLLLRTGRFHAELESHPEFNLVSTTPERRQLIAEEFVRGMLKFKDDYGFTMSPQERKDALVRMRAVLPTHQREESADIDYGTSTSAAGYTKKRVRRC